MARDDIDKQKGNPALEAGTIAYYEKQHEFATGKREREAKARQEDREDRQREIERHEREKTQLRLDIKALWHSRVSLAISILTLAIVLFDRGCPRTSTPPLLDAVVEHSDPREPEADEGETDACSQYKLTDD